MAWGVALLQISACGRENPCLACDRELRKTLESIQAWRRLHGGAYPGRLVELKRAGLLGNDGAICPDLLGERSDGGTSQKGATSRAENGDPAGTYEYEMSDRVLKSGAERMHLPKDAPAYTRQDLKGELLRRPFFEQIPILRCNRHQAAAPPPADPAAKPDARRNATVTGAVYWSRTYWEQEWLADVPYCAREAIALFGLKGPPFYVDRPPAIDGALDLRQWSCAFGDAAWWWTYPMFDEGVRRQTTPNLQAFFQGQHGRGIELRSTRWWLNGLVQLQGRVMTSQANVYREPGLLGFVWERTGLHVGRSFREATWLQGTVWTAPDGEDVGWLVWHYADGAVAKVPLTYGKTTARFWGDAAQIARESTYPEPAWKLHESAESAGRERWVRLYRQSWTNPRPDVPVAFVDFVSNRESPGAPFLVALNLLP
jgi:hypothetical protein